MLTPGKTGLAAEPYLVEIPPQRTLSGHFTLAKAPEIGFVLSGSVRLMIGSTYQTAASGDTIYLGRETPQQWENPGAEPARLLWMTIY
jgi:quercetin dioxygenase-like cupin family protein